MAQKRFSDGGYNFNDMTQCLLASHKFSLRMSPKTPDKANLECKTCTASSGRTTYVAFYEGGFGAWKLRERPREEADIVEAE